MKTFTLVALGALLTTAAAAQTTFYAEAGVSYLALRDARFETAPDPLRTSGGKSEAAPFIAGGVSFTERFGLRLSYHYVDQINASAQFPSPPAGGPITTPVVVWGYYQDEVHLVGLAPEFRWAAGPKLRFTIAPVLNWVASRGEVWYAAANAAVLPGPSRRPSDEDFTFGGSLGLEWSLTEHAAISLSYQYADLQPSFDREAHLISGALRWNF